jgi:4-hydroxy-tetrahydrodipicolinate synthase
MLYSEYCYEKYFCNGSRISDHPMDQPTLQGIIPIVITPFDVNGRLDENSLRRVVRFELESEINGLGVGGFASEAYKLTDDERRRCAEIVAQEVNGRLPLIIGLAPGSTETAVVQAEFYATLHPTALMTLPPATMKLDEHAIVDFYVEFGNASPVPVMVQQSPHIQGYSGCLLKPESLARIAQRCPNVQYFKIEGPGSARRISALRSRVREDVGLFGGVGGIALRDELREGAAGLLPGVGFNEFFIDVWRAWKENDLLAVETILGQAQEVVEAVSGNGHEYSLHARKFLLQRVGIIDHIYVRRPTIRPEPAALDALGWLVDSLGLRISRRQ